MHHTGSKLISNMNISTSFFNKQSQNCKVSILRCKMKRIKLIQSRCINPCPDLALKLSPLNKIKFPGILKHNLERISLILISSKSKQSHAILVPHSHEIYNLSPVMQALKHTEQPFSLPLINELINKIFEILVVNTFLWLNYL